MGGSDWPHPSEQNGALPDDALLFDLLAVWAPEETTRKRILVHNPKTLYGFAKSVSPPVNLVTPRRRPTCSVRTLER